MKEIKKKKKTVSTYLPRFLEFDDQGGTSHSRAFR